MNRMYGGFSLLALVCALAACGGDDGPKVAVTDLPAGNYTVSVGDANAPTVGKYYAAADGSRLLVLADSNDQATQVYRRAAGANWVGVPAAGQDTSVALLRSDALPVASVNLAALAGNYTTALAAGGVARFAVNASGDITASTSACKLSGKLTAGALPNTLALKLSAQSCGSLPASSTDVLAVDADYAPALRLVADNGVQLLDLWAYRE
nr:hypothetical protein [uncultured Albidiferax sp.]